MLPLDEKKQQELRKGSRNWIKYSGMAFQMIGIILILTLAGVYLDRWLGWTPVATVILSLTGVVAGLYTALKDFL
ncbi:AtpZ/AtpI family protein [Neolewinella lacunae]|uniref:AtpZ/AtpI family protein n=1 Tax=Neolewinella lacunae TaxID=1517758 RepID=A0A923PNY4_9BACT|nr:AtpZ/AtpI family protein [Neolewinella lacunae]MBC6993997.1 AtpZ/AtpI family protein [Neolewinella lacunae]MDN3634667.1 AtpZ/AtpI family protein [Neolewinella lacunae]